MSVCIRTAPLHPDAATPTRNVGIEAGAIVLLDTPMVARASPEHRLLGLVIRVTKAGNGDRLWVAKGATKKVSASGHLPTEAVLHDLADLKAAGLHQPTRFDLADRYWTSPGRVRVVGRFPLHRSAHQLALLRAMFAAGLRG